MNIVKDINEYKEVISNGYTFVDFFATWCGPCKMLSPVVEKLAPEYEGKVNFIKVDVDQCPDVAAMYSITSIPTLIVIHDGQPVATTLGYHSYDDVKVFIDNALNK